MKHIEHILHNTTSFTDNKACNIAKNKNIYDPVLELIYIRTTWSPYNEQKQRRYQR